ncbi:TauD/TfdA family dioxygenase [Micromonospora sp. NPDC051227]|uniref:TauD/TfdA family dioxygenase n=1 Tax=Micromonospora sp. NPDC051227 TaxID=3364285 RepID=UPI0037A3DF84
MTPAVTDKLSVDLGPELLLDLATRCPERPYSPYRSDMEFELLWGHARTCAEGFSDDLRAMLGRFRRRRTNRGTLLLRGLPVNDAALGPTPARWDVGALAKRSWKTETVLLAVASLLGEVFSFERQHDGNLVQNVVPVRDDAYTQMGTGSRVFLEWHTEDAYDQLRADFIALLCVRSDPSARTVVVDAADVPVSPQARAILLEPRFHIGVDPASGGSGKPEDGPVLAILEEDASLGLTVRLDTDQVCAVRGDEAAAAALEEFRYAIPRAARYVTLQAGDMLLMDNRRTLHARTAYTPRFDGTDRWLQRVSITTDLQKSAVVRTRRRRVVDREAALFG